MVGLGKELSRIKERVRLAISEHPPGAFACPWGIELKMEHGVWAALIVLEDAKNGSEERATRDTLAKAEFSARVDLAIENDATFSFDKERPRGMPPGGASVWTGKLLDSDDHAWFASVDLCTGISVEIDAGMTIVQAHCPKASRGVCGGRGLGSS